MITEKPQLLSYKDVMIEPARISGISSRKECNPFVLPGNILPIFTAPMSTVVGERSWEHFESNGIIPILPRNVSLEKRMEYATSGKWAAFSLQEFEENFCNPTIATKITQGTKVLIDVANGHMKQIYDLVKVSKALHSKWLEVMIGNIANPETIEECIMAGVDYVRCGVGAGQGCITTSNTSVGYPMASLISETRKWRDDFWGKSSSLTPRCVKTKIIADGGIRGYGDVVKALALGADYVMIGGLFAGCLEAEGDFYVVPGDCTPYSDHSSISYVEGKFYQQLTEDKKISVILYREFYGMASRKGQCDISGQATKTAEGISKEITITITLKNWVENMIAYLRSAMSYCDCKGVWEIYSKMKCNPISAFSSIVINK